MFQIDLSFLFEQPSLWRALVQSLIVATPLAIGLSGFAAWRVGDRSGLMLIFWVLAYTLWMLWPLDLPYQAVLPARVISVIGWVWLIGAWARRVQWHEPLLLFANGIVVAFLIALALTTTVATIRDIMGWDIPA